MPRIRPTPTPDGHAYIKELVAEYGKQLLAESINVARKMKETEVVRSHINKAKRHLDEDTKESKLITVAVFFSGVMVTLAVTQLADKLQEKTLNRGALTVWICILVFSALSAGWSLIRE